MAQFTKPEQIQKYFAYTGAKNFKIYAGVKENLTGLAPLYTYNGKKALEAERKLEEIISLLHDGGDCNTVYSLHCFLDDSDEEKPNNTNLKKAVCTFQFVNEEKEAARVGNIDNTKSIDKVSEVYEKMLNEKNAQLEKQASEMESIKQRLTEIESGDDDDEIGQTPTMQEQFIGALTPIVLNLAPVLVEKLLNGNKQQGAHVNGVVETKPVDEIIERLRAHVPNIEEKLAKLLKMAEENPEQFKVMLNFL